MILKIDELRDKLAGCWAGKNIGGTFGAPFESKRALQNAEFYMQDLSQGPPANDDLDLQIAWLSAVERYGKNVNASILGEYWLSYIIPNWVEYGTGKTNLRAGIEPPLCGDVDNTYKNSNGCWIRSELWACLAPGHPEIAARYAYEDGVIDHAEEGLYGEIFFAAMQSAAFVESDPMKLIEIGLSYIPEKSRVTACVREAMRCHAEGVPIADARRRIHNTAPGTFGVQHIRISDIPKENNEGFELGEPGMDTPENVGFTIAGLLYGAGDYGQSLIMANACGEDTDCTCGTLGALLGIISGASGIPEKWAAPLDDRITTMCINTTGQNSIWIPKTAKELAERVLREIPGFLGQELCDVFAEGGMEIKCDENALFCPNEDDYIHLINGDCQDWGHRIPVRDLCELSSYVVRHDHCVFTSFTDYHGSVFFKKGEPRTISIRVMNNHIMKEQQWVTVTLYLPEGVTVNGASSVMLPLNNLHGYTADATFELNTEFFGGNKLELLADVSLNGRHSYDVVKVTLFAKA